MKIVVIGASGTVGRAVLAVVHRGHVVSTLLVHRVEGQRGQGHRPPGLGFPEVHQHIQPLTG